MEAPALWNSCWERGDARTGSEWRRQHPAEDARCAQQHAKTGPGNGSHARPPGPRLLGAAEAFSCQALVSKLVGSVGSSLHSTLSQDMVAQRRLNGLGSAPEVAERMFQGPAVQTESTLAPSTCGASAVAHDPYVYGVAAGQVHTGQDMRLVGQGEVTSRDSSAPVERPRERPRSQMDRGGVCDSVTRKPVVDGGKAGVERALRASAVQNLPPAGVRTSPHGRTSHQEKRDVRRYDRTPSSYDGTSRPGSSSQQHHGNVFDVRGGHARDQAPIVRTSSSPEYRPEYQRSGSDRSGGIARTLSHPEWQQAGSEGYYRPVVSSQERRAQMHAKTQSRYDTRAAGRSRDEPDLRRSPDRNSQGQTRGARTSRSNLERKAGGAGRNENSRSPDRRSRERARREPAGAAGAAARTSPERERQAVQGSSRGGSSMLHQLSDREVALRRLQADSRGSLARSEESSTRTSRASASSSSTPPFRGELDFNDGNPFFHMVLLLLAVLMLGLGVCQYPSDPTFAFGSAAMLLTPLVFNQVFHFMWRLPRGS